MAITSITSIALRIPYDVGGPKQMFLGAPRTHLQTLLVKVETSSGHTGWGEGFGINLWPVTRAAFDQFIAPFVTGKDEDDIAGLMHQLKHPLHVFGRGGPVAFALSALDIALWDIAAKKAGKPVSALLGGAKRTHVPAYASFMKYGDPGIVARNCERAASLGYRAVKLHETSLDCIQAARAALGPDVALMVDANCAWTFDEAVAMLPELEKLDLRWLEEPTWPPEDHRQLLALAKRTPIPLAAGENAVSSWEIAELGASTALRILQPSVTKLGGLTEMSTIMATTAKQHRVIPHSPYFGAGLIATLQLAAASDTEIPVERLFCDFADHPLGARIEAVDGYLPVPQEAGLGSDPDLKLIEAFAVR